MKTNRRFLVLGTRGGRAVTCSLIGFALAIGASRAQKAQHQPPKPATAPAALDRSAAALKEGDLAAARQALGEVPASPDKDVEARRVFQLAAVDQIEAERGSADKKGLLLSAAAGYGRVLKIKPASVAALYNLARVHKELGDVERASKAFQMAAELPGKEQAFYVREWADFLAASGRWPAAEEAYARLVLLEPGLEEPHTLLTGRFLEQGKAGKPEALLKYAWRLVDAGQPTRAAELAVTALGAGWPETETARDLLTVVAASLGARTLVPGELLSSSVGRQLSALSDSPKVGEGVRQLLALYRTPGQYPLGFEWWDLGGDDWNPRRGVSARDALRRAMRRVGEWHEDQGNFNVAEASYGTAVGLNPRDPDPVALRELANLYIERGDVQSVNRLAARHANIESDLFAGKNQAYARGQLEKVLEYHRTLGQIYGYLALNGKGEWGNSSQPTSAVFQLERAFRVSKKLDDQSAAVSGGKKPPLRLDADDTDLLATAYVQTGNAARGNEVRLEAAQRFIKAGEPRAKERVLEGVGEEALTAEQKTRYVAFKAASPPQAEKDDPKVVKPSPKQWATDVKYVSPVVVPPKKGAEAVPEKPVVPTKESTEMIAKNPRFAHVGVSAREIEVPASASWVDTGIDLTRGREFQILASGRWSNKGAPNNGPGGFPGYVHPGTVMADAPLAALIGKVGETMFVVGERLAGPSSASGRLFLSINDTPGTFGDNQGALKVTITVK